MTPFPEGSYSVPFSPSQVLILQWKRDRGRDWLPRKPCIHSNCRLADIGPEGGILTVTCDWLRALVLGCDVWGIWGDWRSGGGGQWTEAAPQLHTREWGRKGSLVVYKIPAATRDPSPPCCSLPSWESHNPFSKISMPNRFHNLPQKDHVLAHAQLPGTFPNPACWAV